MLQILSLLAVLALTEAQVNVRTPDSNIGVVVKQNQALRKKLAENDEKLKSALGEAEQQKSNQPAGEKASTSSSNQRESQKPAMPQEQVEPAEKMASHSNRQQETQKSQQPEDSKPAMKNRNQDEKITVGFPGDEITVDFPKDDCKKKCWQNKEGKGCEEQCDYDSASKKDQGQKQPKVAIEDDMLKNLEDPMGLPMGIPGLPPQDSQEVLANSATSSTSSIGVCVLAATSLGFLAAISLHIRTRPAPIARPLLG